MNTEYALPSSEAEHVVRASLRSELGLRLSREIEACWPWAHTAYRVFAEASLPRAALLDFAHGGKVAAAPAADDWLYGALVREPSFFIAEDWTARPHDAFLAQRALPTLVFGEQVYYVVRGDPRSEPNWRRICANTVPTFHLFALAPHALPLTHGELTDAAWRGLAAAAQRIVIGVYDGESYLIAEPA